MEALGQWSEFNLAMVGATAALAGLVIVAASVNITEIIRAGTITARLGAAIATLVLAIVVGGAGLVPGISTGWMAAVVLVTAAGAGAFQVHAARAIAQEVEPRSGGRWVKAALGFVPVSAYLVGGVVMLFSPEAGLVVCAVGCLTAIIAAILISWVALVEVLR